MVNKTEIGICGFGYSGSGAVIDLLKEYPEVYVADKVELSFIYKPDGLEDLMRAISTSPSRYFSSDSAIRRFIQFMSRSKKQYNKCTNGEFDKIYRNFIESIIQVVWYGSTSVHFYQDSDFSFFFRQHLSRLLRFWIERFIGKISIKCWPDKKMFYSYLTEEEFLLRAKTFVGDFIQSMSDNCCVNKIVLDQPFCANNPQKSFKFFNNPKAILVTKDPRDLYLLAKNALGYQGHFIPTDNVNTFIRYYEGLMKSISLKDDDNILIINFEDLIYSYDNTRKKIEIFLELSPIVGRKEKKFFPEKSINNTQLWRKYGGFEKDINLIEKELKPYLFSFGDYSQTPTFQGKSF